MVEGLLKKSFPDKAVSVPDPAHAGRQANALKLKVKRYVPLLKEGMEITLDSTGVINGMLKF